MRTQHWSAILATAGTATAFYLPGITPQDYEYGSGVPMKVNRLTPAPSQTEGDVRSAFSYDYYHSAFHSCEPFGGKQAVPESLGSILFGDRIQNSPFELKMGMNETCKAVCDSVTFEPRDASFVERRIRQNYNQNWLVDSLPAAQNYHDQNTDSDFYQPGFALGRMEGETAVLHNHYDMFIEVHKVGQGRWRVVGVIIEPASRKNTRRTGVEFDKAAEGCGEDGSRMILSGKDRTNVTWTYSTYWIESPTTFATRWDKYLHVFDPRIHWFSLVNSAVIVMFLVGMVSTILYRTLRKDIARYNRLDQLGLDDLNGDKVEDGVQEDSGWKLVHGDVFRPPKYALALSVLVGNGAHLFVMAGFTIVFALVGFLSPSNRGSLSTAMILFYTFFSSVGGYVGARVYKSFQGTQWKVLFIATPAAVPALTFAIFFLLNLFVWSKGASGAVPFTTMLVILGIWFVISFPLSIFGSWLGFRQSMSEPPVRTNQIPRQIPPMQGYLRTLPSMLLVGVLPFGAIFVELYFIMNSLWSNRIYYMFGFLFLSFGLLIVTSAAVTILMVYFVLCAENYHWQWRAFASSGASAGYVFAYSMLYWARMLSFSTFVGGIIYLSYSLVLSFLWFLLSGSIGFIACWIFVYRIYGSLKID